jgi:hypothetical protein
MVIGDLNYDILTPDKSQVLDDLCDIFDLTNIVKISTCFIKGCEPSLVDVTNKNNLCFKTLNFNTGVSDCHHMISTVITCWYVGTHESSYAPSVVSTVSPLKFVAINLKYGIFRR